MMTRRELLSRSLYGGAALAGLGAASRAWSQTDARWSYEERPGEVTILLDDKPIAVYVYEDKDILRPYFKDVRTPSGIQVTRNYPPIEGKDPTDHATFHPGIWLGFGDISGADFWRNKARVRHLNFEQRPSQDGSGSMRNKAQFSVVNAYEGADKVLGHELCRYTFRTFPDGYVLYSESVFMEAEGPFVFGDQEEMGFGVRLSTPLTVKQGNGRIVNSDNLVNEKDVWGKKANWCDYCGVVDGKKIGVTLMPYSVDCWFHARDYGLLVANPFGRKAFTQGEPSAVEVKGMQPYSLRFGAFIHETPEAEPLDLAKTYKDFVQWVTSEYLMDSNPLDHQALDRRTRR